MSYNVNFIDNGINNVYTVNKGVDDMETRICKWGNSDGIRIPSSILKALNIKTNDILNIEQQDDKIIITVPKKKKISLKDRFATYHGENLAKDFSWDENIGKEIW